MSEIRSIAEMVKRVEALEGKLDTVIDRLDIHERRLDKQRDRLDEIQHHGSEAISLTERMNAAEEGW